MSTILVFSIALFFHERIPLPPILKSTLYFTCITASALQATIYPARGSDFIKYSNAFLSVAYALRAFELLILHDPSQLKRLEKVTSPPSSPTVYIWKPIPPALSYQRLFYVWDLILNPRAIGWSHGSSRYLPLLQPLESQRPTTSPDGVPEEQNKKREKKFILVKRDDRLPFLAKEAAKLIIAYLIFDAYQTGFVRHYASIPNGIRDLLATISIHISPETSEMLTRRFLLPPACWLTAYSFVDGIHSATSLFAVGILALFSQHAADPWMYPPIFGSWKYLFMSKLREIWGKLWHDLCRRPLLASSTTLIPSTWPLSLKRLLIVFLSFVISGVVHAAGTFAVCGDLQAVFMMMAFFILLPVCIVLQEILSGWALQRVLPRGRCSRALIWVLDVVFVITWGYYTSPWFFRYSMLPEALETVPFPGGFWESVLH